MTGYCKYIINTSKRGMETLYPVAVQALLIVNPTERQDLNMFILMNFPFPSLIVP